MLLLFLYVYFQDMSGEKLTVLLSKLVGRPLMKYNYVKRMHYTNQFI